MLVFSIVEKFSQIFIYTFNHSYNKKQSGNLRVAIIILMQDFLARAKPHRVHEFFFTKECSLLFMLLKISYKISFVENH